VSDGRIDLVVNAAGRGDRRPGERTGTDSTAILAPAIASSGTSAVLLSTMRVLEGYSEPVPDDAPPRPTTPYAEANALHEAQWLASTSTGTVLRLANYFCAPLSVESPQAQLLPWSLVTEALASGTITVRSSRDTMREFVDATDVASALLILSAAPEARVVATAPGVVVSLDDLAGAVSLALADTGRTRPVISFGPGPSVSPPRCLPGWLAHQGWRSRLTPDSVRAVVGQWLAAVT
jgi:nucleoside-diphosphate-sugar epimerase